MQIKKGWAAISKAADIAGTRIHDLRHTYASHLVSAGVSLPVVGNLLGHTQVQTTARYAHEPRYGTISFSDSSVRLIAVVLVGEHSSVNLLLCHPQLLIGGVQLLQPMRCCLFVAARESFPISRTGHPVLVDQSLTSLPLR